LNIGEESTADTFASDASLFLHKLLLQGKSGVHRFAIEVTPSQKSHIRRESISQLKRSSSASHKLLCS